MPRRDDEFDDRPYRDDRDDRDEEPARPRKRGMGVGAIILIVIVVLCAGGLVGGLFFAAARVGESANRMKSSNNLKHVCLAIHNYNDSTGEVPSNVYSPDGKPLLSWRVLILPYIEQEMLFQQFKLNEPWDSPNNIGLLHQMPMTYARPGSKGGQQGTTTFYRGFSSPGAVFDRRIVLDRPRPKKDVLSIGGFADGSENTFLVVEAGDAVEWTKPDDLDASPGKPFPKMGGHNWKGGRFQVVMGDGSVRTVKADTPEATLRAMVTHSGGEQTTGIED